MDEDRYTHTLIGLAFTSTSSQRTQPRGIWRKKGRRDRRHGGEGEKEEEEDEGEEEAVEEDEGCSSWSTKVAANSMLMVEVVRMEEEKVGRGSQTVEGPRPR